MRRASERRCIEVRIEADGRYSIPAGATVQRYPQLRLQLQRCEVIDALSDVWLPWTWCLETDRGFWFLDGQREPREFS